jgi:hypothetical protein
MKLADIDAVQRWWVTWLHPEGSPRDASGSGSSAICCRRSRASPVARATRDRARGRLAGFTADVPAIEAPHVRWEDYDYRVDPAVAEMVRLRAARTRQGGNTLDVALALTRAGAALAEAQDRTAVEAAHAVLAAARDQLEPLDMDDREGVPAPPSITRIVDQALSDATRVGVHDGKAGRTIASRLSRAEDETLADVLTAFDMPSGSAIPTVRCWPAAMSRAGTTSDAAPPRRRNSGGSGGNCPSSPLAPVSRGTCGDRCSPSTSRWDASRSAARASTCRRSSRGSTKAIAACSSRRSC